MSILVDLLDKYIFSGLPSNAALDLIKAAWGKSHEKSWESLYVESFKQAVKDAESIFAKYTSEKSSISLDEDALASALHRDLAVDPASMSYSTLNDQEFAAQLGQAMAQRSVLVIGGHNLSQDDYAQLVRNLVQHDRARFKMAVLENENAFRQALLDESLAMQTRLRGTQAAVVDAQLLVYEVLTYLRDQFELVLGRLDEIRADVQEIKHTLTEKLSIPKTVPQRATVMISSTMRDLPKCRKEVMDACLRQGMFPIMMEHLPASDIEATVASLKMVNEADIYIGVFAHRYDYVPEANNPHQISVTELEYNRAVERKIPRLIFVMNKLHPIPIDDMEIGEDAVKLDAFKKRLLAENIVNFFKSPADLRAYVINSLSQYRQSDLTTFHYVGDIPTPPKAYIAHPYTLLQTQRLIGRQKELNLLTDWITKRQDQTYGIRILNIVAIGGMGKSALTWKWFNDIAPHVMKPLAGQMWWSFYESDATVENFITRALAYVTRCTREDVQKIPLPEREVQLLVTLDREPFLIVLDGLERILMAYARIDATHLTDDDLDKQTANYVAKTYASPDRAAQFLKDEYRLRKTADPRAGTFLRKLANVGETRILVSTRLYPADLQTKIGGTLNGCAAVFLHGLINDDSLKLWRALGVSGARNSLLSLFHRFDNHPLLIQALAREVAHYRPAPGNFERWRRNYPDFDPFHLPLVNAKSHVLDFALHGLDDKARKVLYTIAAFRMPARYDMLVALLVGDGKPCRDDQELDGMLTELEGRGLLGWDKRANRYDLHPIVRGVVWGRLSNEVRRGVYEAMRTYFEAIPAVDANDVTSLDDLTPAIELYNIRVCLGYYDKAYSLFNERLEKALLYRLSMNGKRADLLEMLFRDGLDQLPSLSTTNDLVSILNALAVAYNATGQPGQAVQLYRHSTILHEQSGNRRNQSVGLCSLSNALRLTGTLREAEATARQALLIDREEGDCLQEAFTLRFVGLATAMQPLGGKSKSALLRSLRLYVDPINLQAQGVVHAILAKRALWQNDLVTALSLADQAWALAHLEQPQREGDLIRAARVQGEAALWSGDFVRADERLHYTLTHARAVNLIEEEIPTLIALAELRRQQDDLQAAREFLDDTWEPAQHGPYPLFHADAYKGFVRDTCKKV